MTRIFVLSKGTENNTWTELKSLNELQKWLDDGSLEESDLVVYADEVFSVHEQKIVSLKKEEKP